MPLGAARLAGVFPAVWGFLGVRVLRKPAVQTIGELVARVLGAAPSAVITDHEATAGQSSRTAAALNSSATSNENRLRIE
jgi:hypothetical protein